MGMLDLFEILFLFIRGHRYSPVTRVVLPVCMVFIPYRPSMTEVVIPAQVVLTFGLHSLACDHICHTMFRYYFMDDICAEKDSKLSTLAMDSHRDPQVQSGELR